MEENKMLVSVQEASNWASEYLGRTVTPTNITYLVQYGKIHKYPDESRKVRVNKEELQEYYDKFVVRKQDSWKKKLGKDLDWGLSFDQLREADTTKHVHRLHPYKGKFIPQLVEYFLDENINHLKKEIFFHKGDTVLDPFMGSGTTLVQASELGLNSIGIDISGFNCLISKVKLDNYDVFQLNYKLKNNFEKLCQFSNSTFDDSFDLQLKERLSEFNKKHFPSPDFKHWVREGKVNAKEYGEQKLKLFLKENDDFLKKNGTKDKSHLADEKEMSSFLSKWFSNRIKQELFYYLKLVEKIEDETEKNVMRIVLSRTARSCRATTHSDLATLKEPQLGPYFCRKHGKICTPINAILPHLRKNTYDTVKRIKEFGRLRKESYNEVIHGDSREMNIFEKVKNKKFQSLLLKKKIDGVFTSPPYVGQIDYHEQHAYAYELFGISRKDNLEIGPLYKGQGKKAVEEYVEGISKVLLNISKFVKADGNFFIVANDKYNLYPRIAEKSGLRIVNQFKRPVLNRTERDRQPYAEMIFHMRKN